MKLIQHGTYHIQYFGDTEIFKLSEKGLSLLVGVAGRVTNCSFLTPQTNLLS